MIAIFDTNIFISALLNPRSGPAKLVDLWTDRRFQLLTSEEQLGELRRVSRYPKIAHLISAPVAGTLVGELRATATFVTAWPLVDICRDPDDNYLLAMALVGRADYLVTGDKLDLLALGKYRQTKIVTARQFADLLGA